MRKSQKHTGSWGFSGLGQQSTATNDGTNTANNGSLGNTANNNGNNDNTNASIPSCHSATSLPAFPGANYELQTQCSTARHTSAQVAERVFPYAPSQTLFSSLQTVCRHHFGLRRRCAQVHRNHQSIWALTQRESCLKSRYASRSRSRRVAASTH